MWRTVAILKIEKFRYLQNCLIFTKFHTHISPPNLNGSSKVQILKIQDGERPPFWKPWNAVSPQSLDQFWWFWSADACWHHSTGLTTEYSIWNFENPRWRRATILKMKKIAIFSQPFRRFWQRLFSRWRIFWPPGQKIWIELYLSRCSADADEQPDTPQIRNIALEKACNSGMTFKDTQGHYSCCY